MKTVKFISGPTPKGFKPDFESFLFNHERHRLLQSTKGWQSYAMVREDRRRVVAAIHFCLVGQLAGSPYRAPFGSVEVSKSLSARDLYEFLKRIELELKSKGIKRIQIKNPPAVYQPHISDTLEVTLLNLGYRVVDAEISSSIAIRESDYDQQLEAWELRKLKQGIKAKLRFEPLPRKSLDEVYDFILRCREERGQSLSMSRSEVRKTAKVFPDEFVLFGIFQSGSLAAASISIRVTRGILYNFYSGHPKKLDALSPVVSLIHGMYSWSRDNQIEMIDLGTSAINGQPNFGLLDFKTRLGGDRSSKFTFEKELK